MSPIERIVKRAVRRLRPLIRRRVRELVAAKVPAPKRRRRALKVQPAPVQLALVPLPGALVHPGPPSPPPVRARARCIVCEEPGSDVTLSPPGVLPERKAHRACLPRSFRGEFESCEFCLTPTCNDDCLARASWSAEERAAFDAADDAAFAFDDTMRAVAGKTAPDPDPDAPEEAREPNLPLLRAA